MSLSSPFIRRPVGTALLTIAIALAGIIAYFYLPVAPLPEVEFPTISVQANLPGASPETMASSVATPLERQFGRIAGVTEMTSSSGLGSTGITLQFDLSRDIDGAGRDVQAAINAAAGQLPANLPSKPHWHKYNPSDAPILILGVTSKIYDKPRIYDAVSSVLGQKLSQVEGVGQVGFGGGANPAVRVEINPSRLNNMGLSLEDVRTVLSSANANRPKGSLSDGERTYSLSTTDQLLTAKEYRPLVVGYHNGSTVRLSDVADVVDSVEDIRTTGLLNGKPAVLVFIRRQPGANIIGTVNRILALMPELQASIPAAMKIQVAVDRTTSIRASVQDVEITLVLAIGLVVLVVFFFLRDFRTTLIPSVAVPVSLIGTFGVMYLIGYTIDNLSLMAMTIATGFVVDDAIVVIENITRHLEEGLSPREAALKGASEIGFTVLSISISLVAVFLPILMMSGIVGRLFREFAVTLSVAVMISLLISLTTTPMMCATMLRRHDKEKEGWIKRWAGRMDDLVIAAYRWSLGRVLSHPLAMLLVTIGTVGLTAYLYIIVPKTLFPEQDIGRMAGTIETDQDTSYRQMKGIVGQFVDVVNKEPSVMTVAAFAGGGTANNGWMFITLKPLGERKESTAQVMGRLRAKLSHIPGATLFLQPIQDLHFGGRASSAQFQYTLQGDNLPDIALWAPRVMEKMRSLPGIVDLTSDQKDKGLQASLVIDREAASRLGVSAQAIDATLYDAFGQRQVSTMYYPLNQYHVVMEVTEPFRDDPDSLKYLYVKSNTGALVPLSTFASYQKTTTQLTVSHSGLFPSITISFNLLPGVSLSQAVAEIQDATRMMGIPATVHGSFSGTAQAFQSSLSNELLLVLAALATVYIVLGILYESFIHPITILSTLPSASVGALLALLVTHTELSVIAFIGIILLIGIVKKNAIMMIDFALDAERREHLTPRDAIFAACMLRFRPITMTTMAALLGGLPLAIGAGMGGELRRPLGITIVGGLIFSQMLTLYTTPVIYLYMDRLRLWSKQLITGHGDEAFPEVANA
ncbi:MAG: multidrug efflux RND transporter permease subunit [Phycisphaerae bacterium]